MSIAFRRIADVDILSEVEAGTIDVGMTTRDRVPASLSSVQVPVLTIVYRDRKGRPGGVQHFVDALRKTIADRASRKAPIAMRVSR